MVKDFFNNCREQSGRGLWGFVVLLGCMMSFGMGSAAAQTSLPRHAFDMGSEISYIKYEEPDVMEETGVMFGTFASYTYHNNLMLKAQGHLSFGQVDYDGRLNSGVPYKVDNINDMMLELRGLAGYDLFVSEAIVVIPYFGFGYRYLNDDMGKDIYGYERESNYFYSPIGVETIFSLANGWSISPIIELDIFWRGIQRTHLSDLAVGLSDIDNAQEEGFGVRGSLKVEKEGDKMAVSFEPFIRYWNVSESEKTDITYYGDYIGYGYEPKNNSIEIGCKLAVKF